MSRSFWVVVGAAGGVFAYRKATELAAQSRELGALGTAQAAAATTSRLAGNAAAGLSRLAEVRDRRAGRLVSGSLVADGDPVIAIKAEPDQPGKRTSATPHRRPASDPVPTATAGPTTTTAAPHGSPALVTDSDRIPDGWVPASEVRRAGVGTPVVVESDLAATQAAWTAQHDEVTARATARTTRTRRA